MVYLTTVLLLGIANLKIPLLHSISNGFFPCLVTLSSGLVHLTSVFTVLRIQKKQMFAGYMICLFQSKKGLASGPE